MLPVPAWIVHVGKIPQWLVHQSVDSPAPDSELLVGCMGYADQAGRKCDQSSSASDSVVSRKDVSGSLLTAASAQRLQPGASWGRWAARVRFRR
jgi:hypothetical protein